MVRKKEELFSESPTMDTFGLVLVVLLGSQMVSGQDIPKAIECFSPLNKILSLYTDKINPIACRFPSKTRKSFVPPSVEDILSGKTLTDVSDKFTKACDSTEDGVVSQQEVSELMGVQTDLNSWNVMALLETGVTCAKDAGLAEEDMEMKTLMMAYASFMELLNTTIEDVTNERSGLATCSDSSECGKGKCNLGLCVCDDDDYTGKRCNVEKLNDTKVAQPPLTDAEAAAVDGCVAGLRNKIRNQLTILNPIICRFKLKLKDEKEHSAIRLLDSKEASTKDFRDATNADCGGLTTADTLDEAKTKIASVTDAFKNDFFIALDTAKVCVETSGAFSYPAEVAEEMKKFLSRLVFRIHDLADELLEKDQGGYCRNDTDCFAGQCNTTNMCMCYTDTWGRRCRNGTYDVYAMCDRCYNGASCVFKNGTFSSCLCSYPWTGAMCNVYMRGPSNCSKCLNGGSCRFDSETCYCTPGFMGRFCEFDIAGLLTNLTSADIDTADKCLQPFTGQVQTLMDTINDILCQTSFNGNMMKAFRISSIQDIVSTLAAGMKVQGLLVKNCVVKNNVTLTPEDMKTRLIGAFQALNASLQSDTFSSAMKCINESFSDLKVVKILRHLYSDIIKMTAEAGRSFHHKPGMCPAVTATTFGVCVNKCVGDSDCPFNHKCCSNGCGQVCLPPATGVEMASINLTLELKKNISGCLQDLNKRLQGALAEVNKVLCQMGKEYPITHMSAMTVIDDFSSPTSVDSSCENVSKTTYTHAEMMKVLGDAAATLTSSAYLDDLTKAKACIVTILPATMGNVSEWFDHLYGAVSGTVNMILSAGPCMWMPCKNLGSCVPQGSDYMCSCSALYTGKDCETPFVDPKLPSSLTSEEKDAIKTCIDMNEKNLTDALDNGNLRKKVKCAALQGLTQFQGSWLRKPTLSDIYNEASTSTSGETEVTLGDCTSMGYVNTSDGSFMKDVMEEVRALYGYLNSNEGLTDLNNGVDCLMNVLKDSGKTEDENTAMQVRMRALYDDFSASVKADVAPYMYSMVPTGYCLSHPCQNGGSCLHSKSDNKFRCVCPSGVNGDTCEKPEDKGLCSSMPCHNGGTCINSPKGDAFICQCTRLFGGETCQISICSAKINECGFCVGGSTGVPENKGINKCGGCMGDPDAKKPDCNGVCGGSAVRHAVCGTCYSGDTGKSEDDVYDCGRCVDNIPVRDCAKMCISKGVRAAFRNKCGVCVSGQTKVLSSEGMDVCDVCGGDGSSCKDCDGVPNGPSKLDSCGVCNGTNDCIKVKKVSPDIVLHGSTESLAVEGVGFTGDSSELVLRTSPTDAGSALTVATRNGNQIMTSVPAGLAAGTYSIHYRGTATSPWSDSEASLHVVDADAVAIQAASPSTFTLERGGKTEITLRGTGFPSAPLYCLYQGVGAKYSKLSKAGGTGNERKCVILHPRQGGEVNISLSVDGDTTLGTSVSVSATAPAPVCTVGYNKLGDGICLACDVPISTTHVTTAADIFTDVSALGKSVEMKPPGNPAKLICFHKVDLTAADTVVTLKNGVVVAAGDNGAAATGSLTISAASDPPKPDGEMEGPSTVGTCRDIFLRHKNTGQGRRGQPLTYSQTVVPSDGIAIDGAGTGNIRLRNTQPGQTYTVSQNVCNQAGHCSSSVRVITKKSTPAPELAITVDVDPEKVYRSSKFALRVGITLSTCSPKVKQVIQWSSNNLGVTLNTANRTQYFINPFDLPVGEVTFFVSVHSVDDASVSATASIKLNVVQSDLEARIKGSRRRSVGTFIERLELQGEAADPDDPTSEEGEITRTWTCVLFQDPSKLCSGMPGQVEGDSLILSPANFATDGTCVFTFTASKGVGERRRTDRESVTVEFVQGDICDVKISTDKTLYSASEPILAVARCETTKRVAFQWLSSADEDGFDFIELNTDTADISLSVNKNFFQSSLLIKKGKLNPGSMYRIVASVIYPDKQESSSAIDFNVSPGIKNCELVAAHYTAYDKIFLDTENCESIEALTYQYFYKTGPGDNDLTFINKGKRIEFHGPEANVPDGIIFVVKVRGVESGEWELFYKTVAVQPVGEAGKAAAKAALEEAVEDQLKAGSQENAAAVAATVLTGFASDETRARRKRSTDADLSQVILDAAGNILNTKDEGVDVASVRQVMTSLEALKYSDLTNGDKQRFVEYMEGLAQIFISEDEPLPSRSPQKMAALMDEAQTDGAVTEAAIRALGQGLDMGMISGLNLGDEVVNTFPDRDVKTAKVPAGVSVISGKDGTNDVKLMPGEAFATRFSGSVTLKLVTYADGVDTISSGYMEDKRTSGIFSVSVYDSISGMVEVISSLSEEAVMCLRKTKAVLGYENTPMYYDHTANRWQTTGVTLMRALPPECAGQDFIAMKTSHFTEFSTFATNETNECDSSPCSTFAVCADHVNSYSCTCRAGYTGNGMTCTAISECVSSPCSTNADCAYHLSSHICTCRAGYSGNGMTCTEIDECDSSPCSTNAVCADHVNSYSCTCRAGYSGNGMTCTAISECVSSPCSTNADCAYHLSSHICTCRAGYSGNGMTCTEIDECDSSPCSTNAVCADHVNSYSCTCRAGYSGNGMTCTAISECVSSPCSTNADCAYHLSSHICTCRAGYSGNGMTCTEIDECDSNPCSSNAVCADHVNSYSCTCRAGYSGNGMTCTEIDECDSSPCSTNAVCADHVNSYSCTCRAGYSGNGITCTAISECVSSPCSTNADCAYHLSSHICTCRAGYSGNGMTCTEIDECDSNPCSSNAVCADHVNSYSCTCRAGYSGNGMTCTAISECVSSPCSTNAVCTDHVNSYICTCRAGYSGNGMTCTEIDECDSNPCSSNAVCADHVNSYSCTCRAGYTGNGMTCTAISECVSSPCSTNADCAYHLSSHICTCRAGYSGNGMTCTEIDECDSNPCSSNAVCADHVNSYSCTCRAGYSGNGMTCTEIDECDSSPCSTNAVCADHVNSYSCTCRAGYSGNGITCTAISECVSSPCSTNADCAYHLSSHICTCRAGYSGNGMTCTEIDECDSNPCSSNAVCADHVNSYSCTCRAGYSGNGMTCTAISECVSSPCSTNAVCTDHVNSYICTCRAGYSGNGMTCTEIDECDSNPCSSNAVCADHVNSYSCTCRAGYSGNGMTCTEIDECDSNPCSSNAVCADHVNSYSCTCRAGYTGNGMTCTAISECVSSPCSTNADCAYHLSSHICTCRAGYSGNGMTCTEIDECDSNPCSTNAVCADHVNSYSCTCRAGYTGNGITCTECSYDCANVCDGTATLDCDNTCSGGDTGVTPKMEDACEVCDGDGTSCIAVTAVRPKVVRTDQDQALAVTGTSLSSASVQCVAKLIGSTTEHRVPITSRSSVTSIEVSIEAYALEAGEYTLYCRVTATAALGDSRGTFTVYEPSEATGNPTCVITGPTSIDTCTDLLMNGVSSRGGGVHGLIYIWTISPNTSVTFSEPLDGYASWTGLVADTSYTVTLRVCTIFDTCSTCQETVTKTSAYPPEVSIETVVDVSTAPANREFELFGLAWPSLCPGAPAETDLNYRWTFSNTPGLTINTDRQDDQIYEVRAGDFPPGQTITVTLTVSLASDSSVSAARQLTIVVASSDLEVFIDGGEERTANVNSGLQVFDGSHTVDPDDPTATLVYSWSAAGNDSSGNSIGSCVQPGASTNGPRLSIDPSLLSAGTQCAVMLTVTAGAKTGSMSVTFDIVSGTSPVCFVTNNRPKVRPGDRTLVVVTCTSSAAIRDTVWSSQTRGDVKALDLDAAIADQYTDTLPDSTYMMFLVIRKGVIEGGNKYNLQATITDVNGGQTKTTVVLNVIKGLSGGQLTCPSSYTELSKISITTRKVDGEGGLTYMLLVQTSPGQYMGLSPKKSTGDFSVTGPPAYTGAGNIFHVEVCVVGENGLCKTLSCEVPTVNAVSGADAVVAEIKAEINRLKSQSRSMEAAVLLCTLYRKTEESSLPADLVSLVTDIATKRTMNDASASTFLDILTSVPPQTFTATEFATLASQIGNVADYFINNDIKVPERYLARLNAWISDAKGAGASSTEIATVEAKADLAATSGIEYGNSATYDLTSSLVSVVNDIPGDDLKVKDGSNNDVKINFGESVRSKLGYKNVVIKVTSFKTTPPAVTQSSSAIAPIIDISFMDPSTNKEKSVTGLQKPASIAMALNSDQANQGQVAQCVYWDTATNTWSLEGVATSIQTGTNVECKASHFTTYTVIHAHQAFNDDHNVGMIVGVVLGIIILMIVIILIVVFLFYKCTRNKVLDISRSSSRMNNTGRRNSRSQSRVHTSYDSPHRLVDSPSDKRPGSGDGLKRSIN